jgi:hypothetical protein
MHAMAGESKTISSRADQVPPSISSDGASMRKVFWRWRSLGVSSVGRDVALLSSLGQVFFVVFVESVVAVFGLASVELCCPRCSRLVAAFLYSNLCLL